MHNPLTIETSVHFLKRGPGARQVLRTGPAPEIPTGKLPRITRLMAFAIHFDELIRTGDITDYAELARVGQVTRARVTQIMNLLLLAPDIQEAILFLPRIDGGRDPLPLRRLQPICLTKEWGKQRGLWEEISV